KMAAQATSIDRRQHPRSRAFPLTDREFEATLLPQLLPSPCPLAGFESQRKTDLMGEHAHLSAVMRVMGNHIGEHGRARSPRPRPAVAKKVLDTALGSS